MRPFDYDTEFIAPSALTAPASPLPPQHALHALARLIDWGGWPWPIVIDEHERVIAGAARLAAAQLLGASTVPTVRAARLPEDARAAFIAADQRLCAMAGWGAPLLAWDRRSFDANARKPTPAPSVAAPAAPAKGAAPETITRTGDVWRLGPHRLMCADACNVTDVGKLARDSAGEFALVLADPPQNLFGDVAARDYAGRLLALATAARTQMLEGALLAVAMDWRNYARWLAPASLVDLHLRDMCVWTGAGGPAGALYAGGFRLVALLRSGDGPHIRNGAEPRSSRWDHAPAPEHPSALPPALLAEVIEDATPAGASVLDLCAGPGFALRAAMATGRRAFLMEQDPAKCDAILARYADEAQAPTLAPNRATSLA